MSFVVKSRGDRSATIVCIYTCPVHGEFDAEVKRDEQGSSPDLVACPVVDDCWDCGGQPSAPGRPLGACITCDNTCTAPCALDSTWTPSSAVSCRVRRVEVTRGKWEKPERHTFLDTRKLGEGQDPEEFQAERKRMWTEERRKKVKDLLR